MMNVKMDLLERKETMTKLSIVKMHIIFTRFVQYQAYDYINSRIRSARDAKCLAFCCVLEWNPTLYTRNPIESVEMESVMY